MNTSTLGTVDHLKELKELLLFGFKLQAVLADFVKNPKKNKWLAAFKFMPVIPTILPAFEGLGNPLDHFKALSPLEKADLYDYFRREFSIQNEELESVIEDTINVASTNIALIRRYAEAVKK